MKSLGDPLQLPATKLASEHHGGKAGRFWKHKQTKEGLRPVTCKVCGSAFVFDASNNPFCSGCGREPEIAKRSRMQSSRQEHIQRIRSAKKWRMYAKT